MDEAERIRRIFREALAIDVPSSTTDVIDNGMLDSLALVTLLYELEQEFALTIPLDGFDIDDLRTIERIVLFVDGIRAAHTRS